MVKKIYKYPLERLDQQTVMMPAEAEILYVAPQHNKICIWALIDPNAEKVSKTIKVVGSGEPFDQDFHKAKYLGSAILDGGMYVWHVFETGRYPEA